MDADLGGTELLNPLRAVLSDVSASSARNRVVFLLTDGQVDQTQQVLTLFALHSPLSHSHNLTITHHTHSSSLVLVVMMKSKELKIKISHAHSLSYSLVCSIRLLLCHFSFDRSLSVHLSSSLFLTHSRTP